LLVVPNGVVYGIGFGGGFLKACDGVLAHTLAPGFGPLDGLTRGLLAFKLHTNQLLEYRIAKNILCRGTFRYCDCRVQLQGKVNSECRATERRGDPRR